MSGPASTSARVLLDGHHPHRSRHSYHHHHTPNNSTPPTPPPAVAEQPPAVQPSSTPSSSSPPSSALARDYRKGNWTLHETLIMINAKRLDNERRVLRQCRGGAGTSRTAELRWKWVENHCWKNGCLRSQNQCNDKWDNLLRDYRKVRNYEEKATSAVEACPSYWAMEKHERKERNLPSNLVAEVFDALTDVLSRRNARRSGVGAFATPVSSRLPPHPLPPPSVPPPPPQEQPAPPPPLLPPQTQPTVSVEVSEETSGTEEGGHSGSSGGEAKRRRVGRSVVQGVSVVARTLLACQEKEEKRHRDMVELDERRLRIEKEHTEMSRRSFAGLIDAVNNLSGAIQAFASSHHPPQGHLHPR